MGRRTALLALTALALLTAGCLGFQGGSTPSSTASPTLSDADAGERAVAAEEDRLRRLDGEDDRIVGLTFEMLDRAEYEVRGRNASGVVVRVTSAYSASIDCDRDGDPELASDGASTVATYQVAGPETRLLGVSQAFLAPERHC